MGNTQIAQRRSFNDQVKDFFLLISLQETYTVQQLIQKFVTHSQYNPFAELRKKMQIHKIEHAMVYHVHNAAAYDWDAIYGKFVEHASLARDWQIGMPCTVRIQSFAMKRPFEEAYFPGMHNMYIL